MAVAAAHGTARPSAWVLRWAHLLRPAGRVLDVACGGGRHLHALDGRGFELHGVDRDAQALQALAGRFAVRVADIETGPWPYGDERFDGLIVTHYLWRALLPTLAAALAPGGVALMETFAQGQEAFGRPSNPAFLLRPGELLEWAAMSGLRVVAFEDGLESEPTRRIQRIAAVRGPVDDAATKLAGSPEDRS